MPSVNYLLFPVPTEIVTLYDTAAFNKRSCSLFNGNNLILRLLPGVYQRTTIGGDPELRVGYAQTRVIAKKRRVGFELNLTDGRFELYKIFCRLQNIAMANDDAVAPIVCYDYVHPEVDDEAQGFTLREGIFTEIQPKGGTISDTTSPTSRRWNNGIQIKFEEINLRDRW